MPQGSVPVETLQKHGPEYDASKLALYESLYAGGAKFDAIKEQMLTKREIEASGKDAGARSYKLRLDRAAYVNRCGGIIDFFTAAVFKNHPRIVPHAEGDPAEYWLDLNNDADGLGTNFETLCRHVLREMLVSARPYVKVSFNDELDPIAATLSLAKAQTVDDWQFAATGELYWVRVYGMDIERPMIPSDTDPAMERHTWSFYKQDGVDIYEAKKPVGEPWDEDAKATLVNEESGTHDLGIVPFFDCRTDEGLWLVERLYDTIKALYNREAATQFALDAQCFAVPVITTDDTANLPSIQASQVLALCLKTGESFNFIAPPTAVFTSLQDDIERLRKSLYEVIQSMAMNAASIPQAGNLSGDAVEAMQMPMTTLTDAFAWPVKNVMQRVVDFLKEYRGDEFDIVLEGFEQEVKDPETEEELEDGVKQVIGADGEVIEQEGEEKEPTLSADADKSGLKPGAKTLPKWGAKATA